MYVPSWKCVDWTILFLSMHRSLICTDRIIFFLTCKGDLSALTGSYRHTRRTWLAMASTFLSMYRFLIWVDRIVMWCMHCKLVCTDRIFFQSHRILKRVDWWSCLHWSDIFSRRIGSSCAFESYLLFKDPFQFLVKIPYFQSKIQSQILVEFYDLLRMDPFGDFKRIWSALTKSLHSSVLVTDRLEMSIRILSALTQSLPRVHEMPQRTDWFLL